MEWALTGDHICYRLVTCPSWQVGGVATMSEEVNAILESLDLDRQDAGIVLGAFLAAPKDDRNGGQSKDQGDPLDAIFNHLEAAWAQRCRRAVTHLRGLDSSSRGAALRALSAALANGVPETWVRPDVARRAHILAALETRLETLHPQVATSIVMSLPPSLGRALARFASTPSRLPAALRRRVVKDELARIQRALPREDKTSRDTKDLRPHKGSLDKGSLDKGSLP